MSLYYDVEGVIPCGVLPASLRLLYVATVPGQDRAIGLAPCCLPAGLTELCWGGTIGDGLVAGLLPSSLRELKLVAFAFNAWLDGVFPPNSQLQTLSIASAGFVYPFQSGTLPRTLTELDMTGAQSWNQSLDGVLPPALRVLRLGERFRQPLTAATFATCQQLETLDLGPVLRLHSVFPVGALPPSLTDLRYPRGGGSHVPLVASLPASLRKLSLHHSYRIETLRLPHTVQVN